MFGNRHGAALLAPTLVLACDLPPIEYETEYLRIGTDSAEPVCAGTLHELDAQVRLVEEVLDIRVETKLELYLFEDTPSQLCKDDVAGCYDHKEKRAYTLISAAGHEIVHATIHQNIGFADSFFDEGLAVDLTGRGLPFPRTYPASNLGLPASKISQPTAGHFMRWLRSQYTESEIKNIVIYSEGKRGAKRVADAFAKVTNHDFGDVEQLYLDTAPEFYAPFDIVVPPTVAPTANGWDLVVSFDCTQVSTQGFGGEMWRRVRIEVTDPGPYVFVTTPPATAAITHHHTEDVQVSDPIPAEPPWPIGDDWFEAPGVPLTDWPIEIQLEPGLYDIEIRVPGASPTTAAVGLYPKLGHIPTLP